METLNSIQNRLRQYVDGELGYAQFRTWIADVYADCAPQGDSAELRLCQAIEWECADFSEGLLPSEDFLRQALALLCSPTTTVERVVPAEFQQLNISTGTSTISLVETAAVGQFVGVERASEYAL